MDIQSASPRPLLSIVIVNYNVRDLLENALHSVGVAMRGIPGEVFVVDNASDDGSAEMVERKFPEVRLIRNLQNAGFARANNQAFREARGAFILVLNPDTLLQEDTLQVMLRFFEENPDVGMAGCKIIEPDGTYEPNSRRSFPSPWVAFTKLSGLSALFPRSRLFGRYNLTYLSDDESYEIDALSGCFTMLRREVYDAIGGFDEEYFMYGEDLDWCYRAQKSGWKIYYVPATKIIHYGGESTKRSNIDAKAVFYEAMRLFVRKNLPLSRFGNAMIGAGIRIRLRLSRSRYRLQRAVPLLFDALFVVAAIMLGELIRFGAVFSFPAYAYPTAYIAAVIIYLGSLAASAAYTSKEHEIVRSLLGVLLGFLITSALVFFFKNFAFSRGVVLISGVLLLFLIPAPRVYRRLLGKGASASIITGRPTLLVGINEHIGEVIEKLRAAPTAPYRLVGIIDVNRKRIGEEIAGVPIVGSTANIGKVILERETTDVIFLPDILSYSEIFSIISRSKGLPVHYRMAARTMDLIVGRAEIDQLSSVPLVDVDYNLVRASHRFVKRALDIAASLAGLMTLYPFVYFFFRGKQDGFTFTGALLRLPAVFRGAMTLVGRNNREAATDSSMYLGKPGITGLVQLQEDSRLTLEDIFKLELQYARNQSLFLDVEILLRTLLRFLKR